MNSLAYFGQSIYIWRLLKGEIIHGYRAWYKIITCEGTQVYLKNLTLWCFGLYSENPGTTGAHKDSIQGHCPQVNKTLALYDSLRLNFIACH